MPDEIRRLNATDAGCWIEGHWGQYGIARMLEIAAELGWSDRAPIGKDALYEDMAWAAADAHLWMNEHVAPEGFSFGWHDGEFFLWSDEQWDEDAQ